MPQIIYQIRVKEHLDSEWAGWFAPLVIVNEPNGEATLTGSVVDQAALHGLLNKLFSLNLTLIALAQVGAKSDR
jgi:hypothetical protein